MNHRTLLFSIAVLGLARPTEAQTYFPISPLGAVPASNTTDAAGNTYSVNGSTLIKTTPGGTRTTLATAQPAPPPAPVGGSQGPFEFTSVVVDALGNVYAAESPTAGSLEIGFGTGEIILKISPAGVLTTINVAIASNHFDDPNCVVAVDGAGDLFSIAPDYSIIEVNLDGSYTTIVGVSEWRSSPGTFGGSGPSGVGGSYPTTLAADSNGDLFVSGAFSFMVGEFGFQTIMGPVEFVAVGFAPTLIGESSGQSVYLGADSVLAVEVAAASPQSLSFQWYFNGTPVSSGVTNGQPGVFGLADSVSSELSVNDVQAATAGNYTVVVTNSAGSVTSPPLSFVVVPPPITYSASVFASSPSPVSGPNGVAVDGSGSVYVTVGNAVEKVTSAGSVTLVAGSLAASGSADGQGAAASFNNPSGIATDGDGYIYVADSGNNSIRKVSPAGAVVTLAGLTQGNADGLGIAAQFDNPTAVAVDADGNVYVADTGNDELRKITSSGDTTTILFGSTFTFISSFDGPITYSISGVCVDSSGTPYVGVMSSTSSEPSTRLVTVLKVGGTGTFSQVFQVGDGLNLHGPGTKDGALAIDGSGNIFVLSADALFEATTEISGLIGFDQSTNTPVAIAADAAGRIFVANPGMQYIDVVAPVGTTPIIAVQPLGGPISFGEDTTLSVVASATPSPSFQWQVDGASIAGATSSNYTTDVPGTYTVVVSNSAGSVTSSSAVVKAATRLINISSRAYVGTGSSIEIAGFVVSGPPGGTEQVLIRGAGPSLAQFGLSGVLAQPVLILYDSAGKQVASNAGWNTSADASAIAAAMASTGAFAFPLDSADSALLVSLPPGAYTAQIVGLNGSTGVALAEVYEVAAADPELVNISTRAFVSTASNVEIGGFVVTGSKPAKVLIRAIGPALAQFGVIGVLAQPSLSIVNSSGAAVASNTGWSTNANPSAIASEMAAVGAFALPPGSADCALLLTLSPGAYTAVVSGAGGTSGVALVEAYQAP
jgi:sugar lactone lactonase YvrE